MHFKVAGTYTLEVARGDGSIRHRAEFRNLITDAGLERMGTNSDYLDWCQVGSGSTAPSTTDTALVSRIGGASSFTTTSQGAQASAPYYAWRTKTFSFAPGTATGNIAEVGVGWATSGGLFSRALVLDSEGDPTTITVLSDETLYVTYEFRLYPDTTDNVGEVVFTGGIGGTYDWTWRAASVTSSSFWDIAPGGTSMGGNPSATAYTGTIGAVTTTPSGTTSGLSIAAQAYSATSLERRFNVTASLSQGNLSGGIRSLSMILGPTRHQVQFDPAIPKTGSDTLALVVAHSWGRL